MNWKKFVRKEKGIIAGFILIGILVVMILNVETVSIATCDYFYPGWDENPFDRMRECENQYSISGYLLSVDYIDGGYQNRYTLIIIDDTQMNFKDWDYKRFKPYEGQDIEMVYYSNCETSEYYLNCVDNDRFGYDMVMKPLT